MDRFFKSPRLLFVCQLTFCALLAGCSSTHNFLAGCNSDACSSDCVQDEIPCCAGEVCAPLIADTCCESVCCDGSCTAEGCCDGEGCGPRRKRKRHTGLRGGIVHGRENIILDGAGWVMGIPQKILLWNHKVDSHSVSSETIDQLERYLASEGLDDVKVRVNQYDPIEEWKRLAQNKSLHAGWRYTFGAYAVTKYTLAPGRLFGADEYNPFTNTISIYSDRPSIALREGARAKQALDATYPGTWAASNYLPGSPLWIDYPAIREVIRYSKKTRQRKTEREAYLVLFPAYGARIGGSATLFLDTTVGQAAQGAFALVGHAVGRTMAFRVSEGPIEMAKSAYGIVKRPQPDSPATETADVNGLINESEQGVNNPMPVGTPLTVKLIPVEVLFDRVDDSI